MRGKPSSPTLATPFVAIVATLGLCLGACSSTPEPRQAEPTPAIESEPEPEPVRSVELAAVPHDGPLAPDPGYYDCGHLAASDRCEFGIVLTNTSTAPLLIERIAQDFAVTARVGLVEHGTGFDRDLPYDMAQDDVLRLLFWYRCEDPNEQVGGSLIVRYVQDGADYRLEIPVGCGG